MDIHNWSRIHFCLSASVVSTVIEIYLWRCSTTSGLRVDFISSSLFKNGKQHLNSKERRSCAPRQVGYRNLRQLNRPYLYRSFGQNDNKESMYIPRPSNWSQIGDLLSCSTWEAKPNSTSNWALNGKPWDRLAFIHKSKKETNLVWEVVDLSVSINVSFGGFLTLLFPYPETSW